MVKGKLAGKILRWLKRGTPWETIKRHLLPDIARRVLRHLDEQTDASTEPLVSLDKKERNRIYDEHIEQRKKNKDSTQKILESSPPKPFVEHSGHTCYIPWGKDRVKDTSYMDNPEIIKGIPFMENETNVEDI